MTCQQIGTFSFGASGEAKSLGERLASSFLSVVVGFMGLGSTPRADIGTQAQDFS